MAGVVEGPQVSLRGHPDVAKVLKSVRNKYLEELEWVTYADASTTTYTWDDADRLTQVVDSISGTITLTWDDFDRLTREVTPQGTTDYVYDAAGRRTSMTVAGQAAVNYSYDDADRLTQITQGSSTVMFAHDNADRRTRTTLPNGISMEYAYDDAGQLIGIDYKQDNTLIGDLTYQYDQAGNRIAIGGSFARTGLPQPLASAVYDAANRLTQWGATTLTYDDNGNLTNDGAAAYTWDARDRLTAMTGASFQYDPFGRRTSKTVGGATTQFLYDGVNPVQEISGTTANLLTSLGIDEVLARTDSSGARHFLTDALGSTLALLDPAGALQTQYTYEPFGKVTVSGPSSGNPFQYTGRENDGTGLYYYRARYYHPGLQRFISEDPIGFLGGLNLYAYVGNKPVSWSDPVGLWSAGAHDFLLQHALRGIASDCRIQALQQSSREFDKATQATRYAPLHSMARPGQSSPDAILARDAFINHTLQRARRSALLGSEANALELLGQALHPIMDSSSPMHVDSGGLPRTWGCFTCVSNILRHSPSDHWGGETIRHVTPEILRSQSPMIQAAYRFVFGGGLSGRK